MIKKIATTILALSLAVSATVAFASASASDKRKSTVTVNDLFVGSSVTITPDAALPEYMKTVGYGGKKFDRSEITAVKISTEKGAKKATVNYTMPINLYESNKDTGLVEFLVANSEAKEYNASPTTVSQKELDFLAFAVRFTDVNDPSVYMQFDYERRQDFYNVSSVRVSTDCQKSAGYVPSSNVLRASPYGTPVRSAFSGCPSDTSGTYEVLTTSYDGAAKAVYASPSNGSPSLSLVRDLDDAEYLLDGDDLWSGFSTGEVYVSFEFTRIMSERSATVYLFAFNGQDLTGSEIVDVNPPVIQLENASFGTNPPTAEVGTPYRVFGASAYDGIDGRIESRNIRVRAYTRYGKEDQNELPITGGAFIPETNEKVTLEYYVEDSSGNGTTRCYEVPVSSKIPEIVVYCDGDIESAAIIGKPIAMPTAVEVRGGAGAYEKTCYLKNLSTGDKEYIPLTAETFTFTKRGYFEMFFETTDYIGKKGVRTFLVKADYSDLPLVDLPAMPEVFARGKSFVLPDFKATDDSSFGGINANARKEYLVSFDSGNSWTTYYPGDRLTVTGEVVLYKIVARTITDASKYSESDVGTITVVNPTCVGDFFVNENGVTPDYTFDAEYPVYSTENGTFTFANMLGSEPLDFSMQLFGGRFVTGSKLRFSFRDGRSNVRNELTIEKKDEKLCKVYVNGKYVKEVNFAMSEGNTAEVRLSGANAYYNSTLICAFDGITGAGVYFSFEILGAGSSSVMVKKINNQTYLGLYEDERYDYTAPVISLDEVNRYYSVGEEVVVPAASAFDVLDSECNLSVSLTKNGTTVYSENGKANGYSFIARAPGDYKLVYTAVDSLGNTAALSYTIRIINRTRPTLTVDGAPSRYIKAGQTLSLPRASAKDAEGNAIEVYTMVVYPDGKIEKTSGTVVLQSVGVYKIRYVCVDRDYNVTAREYLTEVR